MPAVISILSLAINTYYPVLFLGFGCASIIFFNSDIFIPIWISVIVFVGVSLYLLHQYRRKRLGVLMLLLWLVYTLPFIHIVPYLWFDFDSEAPLILWGLAVNPYMLDEQIIKLTAMIGAVGGLGFALGISLNNKKIVRDASCSPGGSFLHIRTLSLPVWFMWVFVGVALSWLAAPQDLLFTATYTTSASALESANFSSAWMISYVLLTFALCDSILDRNTVRKTLKRQAIICAIIFVAIYLQLLRGDRAVLPFVFGALLIYFYWAAPATQKSRLKLPWLKIMIGGLVLVVVSMIIGATRYSLVGMEDIGSILSLLGELVESDRIGISNLLHGTWSAVLLTPISVAGDHIYGLLSLKLGQTYLDLLLSIPPGFVADAVGYARPIDSFSGPAWEMRYGLGGTHASVVPFMNFRMIGVFLIPAIWAYIFSRYEKHALRRLSVINLSLLGSIALASAHWLWYGEKNGFNVLIIWFLLAVLYRVSLLLSNRSSSLSIFKSLKTDARN